MPYQGYYSRRDLQEKKNAAKTEAEEEWVWDRETQPEANQEAAADPETAGKTENFFSNHVKLITFLICLAVFLTFFGPWSISRIVEWRNNRSANVNPYPEERLQELIDKGEKMTWADLGDYSFAVTAKDVCYTREYKIAGGNYYLMVSADTENGPITSAYLIRISDSEKVDIINGDATGFLK